MPTCSVRDHARNTFSMLVVECWLRLSPAQEDGGWLEPQGSYQIGEPQARSSIVSNLLVAEYVLPLRVMLQHPS